MARLRTARGSSYGLAGDPRHRRGALPLRPRSDPVGAARQGPSRDRGGPAPALAIIGRRSHRPTSPRSRTGRWRRWLDLARTACRAGSGRRRLGDRRPCRCGGGLPAAGAQRGRNRAGGRPRPASPGCLGHRPGGAPGLCPGGRGRPCACGRAAPLSAVAPRPLPARRRVPGGAGDRDRAHPRDLVRLRYGAEADSHRVDLFLSDRGQHPRWPSIGRPRPGEDAHDAESLAARTSFAISSCPRPSPTSSREQRSPSPSP